MTQRFEDEIYAELTGIQARLDDVVGRLEERIDARDDSDDSTKYSTRRQRELIIELATQKGVEALDYLPEEGRLLYLDAIYIIATLRDLPDAPGPQPEPPTPPPAEVEWNAPNAPRVYPFTLFDDPIEVKDSWKGRIATANKPGMLKDTTITGFYGEGLFDFAGAKGVRIEPDGAMFAVGVQDHQPKPEPQRGEDYFNTDRPARWAGWLFFHGCEFFQRPGTTEWRGFGTKMAVHPQSDHSLWIQDSEFGRAREHSIYCEWVRHLYVDNTLFADTGGNAIQVTSRGGNPEFGYMHGNSLQPPAGLNGWAYLEHLEIMAEHHGFRDSSEISFAGFAGPVVMKNITIDNCISAVAMYTDHFKGCWLANGDDIPWSQPKLFLNEDEIPEGLYSCPELWIDNLNVTWDEENGKRSMVMISGVQNVHIGRFAIGGSKPAIDLDSLYGGPCLNGTVRFYDRPSVMAHLGRIGSSRSGRFVPYSLDQLESMIVA